MESVPRQGWRAANDSVRSCREVQGRKEHELLYAVSRIIVSTLGKRQLSAEKAGDGDKVSATPQFHHRNKHLEVVETCSRETRVCVHVRLRMDRNVSEEARAFLDHRAPHSTL